MKVRFTQCIGALLFLLIGNISWAQLQTPLDIALRHVEDNHKLWNLTDADVEGMIVSDMYVNKQTGTTYIYFNQSHNGIKMQAAMINLSILDDGHVNYVGKKFISDLSAQISTTSAGLNSDQALQTVMNDLNIQSSLPKSTEVNAGMKYTYEAGVVSRHELIAELMYKQIDGEIHLVWDIIIDLKDKSEKWDYAIDANSNQILQKRDLIIRCSFGDRPFHNHDAHCGEANHTSKNVTVSEALSTSSAAVAGSYRVFAMPTESPNHGPFVLVSDPDDPTASPFGWHDTNGDADPEFTYTRGNNTHAFLDRNDDFAPDVPEPEGGMTLTFDFPFDPNLDAVNNADAAVVNLFYWMNLVHDFSYLHGFDEAAGNFQTNNYGNGGFDGDAITARAQAAADAGSTNNAFYSGGSDGQAASVNMFVWDETAATTGVLNIDAPASVAGQYNTSLAGFGAPVTETPITGEVVEVNDNVFDPFVTDGCEEFVNSDDIAGKIALIDRGGCFFQQKAVNAEAAGAIAIIVCNFEDALLVMGAAPATANLPDPGIPAIMIQTTDCATIRQFASNGLEATIVLPSAGNGPPFLDGDFDSGIIAHEYAHGISSRITGGPSAGFECLSGEEQMGEGWSDFFGIAMTVKSGDTGDMRRGVGTYVQREDITGTGIRTFPYSTDMNINPHTYEDINTLAAPHGVGSVWCVMLWDLYWRMVDEYGFDDDLMNGDGGNNRAVKLVVDGMKNQGCNPGFVDGRNGILAADMDLYGGANQCLIWEVFARRGVGYLADQGSSASQSDQVVNFEPLPTCIAELKISKSVTPLINAGDNIDAAITVINHKDETLTGVVVTDELIDGTQYIEGSCSLGESAVTVTGNMISFDLGEMAFLDEVEFTYQLSSDPNKFSVRGFFEDVENPDLSFWFPIIVTPGAPNVWEVNSDNPNSGEGAWYVEDIETESQQILQAGQPSERITVSGDNPVLRFFHAYDTELGADGGAVEISTDPDGLFWEQLGEKMFRGGYEGFIQYATFVIPDFGAFYGNSNGYKATYVDLSEYAGQEVILRWNFATDDNTAPAGGGWWLDDIEVMDMINYDGEACATSDQGDEACANASGRGTVVESQLPVSVGSPIDPTVKMNVFPNPTDDLINLAITSEENQNMVISLMTMDGREVMAERIQTSTVTQTYTFNVAQLPSGMYFLRARTNKGVVVEKIAIN